MFNKLSLKDFDLKGKRVLLRVDYNVPLNSNLQITNTKRIRASLPTLKYLIEHEAKIIIISHLGRPDGKEKPEFSLKPVAEKLGLMLKRPVLLTADVGGTDTYKYVRTMREGDIIMVENLRFDPGEEANDFDFANRLACLGDIFCNDAFGTMHRSHASITRLPEILPACVGLLVEKELSVLGAAIESPKRPYVVILGGAKVKDKISLISRLIDVADVLLIGGAMSYTFLSAAGFSVGRSIIEKDKLELAKLLLDKAKRQDVKMVLPTDHVATGEFSFSAPSAVVQSKNFPNILMGMDIGPSTIKTFKHYISKASTIFWNGPLGVVEFDRFSKGTEEILKAVANSKAFTIVGGGDTAKCVEQAKLQSKINFVSTGGGATLALMEGVGLPGLKAIKERI
ncbi:MAG: phosphoglycerate kinase [Clostridia bacterium]|nr:phosphoglycerate kinase [Clostridia bacterium]